MSEEARQIENLFLALGDRTRLRLLNLMSGGEICVCFFTEALQEPQPKVSRHLAYLRQTGLVKTRREGKWIYYRLAEPSEENAARIFQAVQGWFENDAEMRLDRERLLEICCAPNGAMPVTIQRAAKNNVFANADVKPKLKPKEVELADFLL